MRLIGKTAVVTGGASGMGESMCYALANEGASTVVLDRNAKGADAVASKIILDVIFFSPASLHLGMKNSKRLEA